MENKKILIFVIIILILGGFVFTIRLVKNSKDKQISKIECPIKTIGLSRETYEVFKTKDPNIVDEVRYLQLIFSRIPNIGWQVSYKITGDFGYGTEALLRRFQKAYGLNNTGIIDEATRDKLCEIWEYQARQLIKKK